MQILVAFDILDAVWSLPRDEVAERDRRKEKTIAVEMKPISSTELRKV